MDKTELPMNLKDTILSTEIEYYQEIQNIFKKVRMLALLLQLFLDDLQCTLMIIASKPYILFLNPSFEKF